MYIAKILYIFNSQIDSVNLLACIYKKIYIYSYIDLRSWSNLVESAKTRKKNI